MRSTSRRSRRVRPLDEVPVDELCKRSEDLAKEWLVVVLEQEPLVRAPSIAAAGLAQDGPAICQEVLRALGDEAALAELGAGGSAERLVARAGTAAGARTPEEVSRAVEALRGVLWRAAREALPGAHGDDVALLAERLAVVTEAVRGAALRAGCDEGDSAWPAVLEEQIILSQRTGMPVSLLLVELEDADRLIAVEPPGEAQELLARLDSIVRRSVRPGDVVVSQRGGRAWVIAPGADRAAGEELGSALGDAVQACPPWRGAPLRATIGVAVLDEDAPNAAGLIEATEERRFEAAASGIEISRRAPQPAD